MSLRKEILFLLLVTVAGNVVAQPCAFSFSGMVVNENDEALPAASVFIKSLQKGAVTNARGNFQIAELCAGDYSVEVQYLGYEAQVYLLHVEGDVKHSFRMIPDLTQLSEVVVQEKIEHVENYRNFVQLNEKQLSEAAGKSLGEALKEVTGVSAIQAGPGIFKPVIHGVHSQRVLILNHGIRQEGQQWGAEHAPEIDPFIASDIVVIKDASAIKYGADALGGVVVVNPPSLPTQQGMGGSLQSILQSNGRSATLAGTLEGGLKNFEGWGWRLQGSARQAGDFHAPGYSLTNTGVKDRNFSGAVGYHGNRGGIEVFFSHFQTTLGILKGSSVNSPEDLRTALKSETPLNTAAFGFEIDEPRQEVSHDLLKINGHMENTQGEWRMQYGFQNNQRKEFDVRRGSLTNLPSIDLQLFTHTLEAEWESIRQQSRSLCVGITGMIQDNNNVYGTQRIPFIPNFTSVSGGVFGVANFYFKRGSVDIGTRYDYKYYDVAGFDFKNALYKQQLSFHNLSATVGATWQVKKNHLISTSLSNAWRPPHVAELFSLGTHQSAAAIEYGLFLNEETNEVMEKQQVDFENEKALKWVVTYQRKGKSLVAETSVFANYIFNYFYLRPTGVTQNVRGVYPYFRYTQTDAFFTGADVSLTWQAFPSLKLSPKISYLRASDVSNHDYLVFIPANRFEMAARYEGMGAWKDLYFEAKGKYVLRQFRAPRVIDIDEFLDASVDGSDPLQGSTKNFDFQAAPDGFLVVGLSSGYSLRSKKVRYDFRVSVENLLNTRYRDYTNRLRYYADDLGRNFSLSVKCIF